MKNSQFARGWLSGFFDGEGHIQFLRKEDGHHQTICRLYAGNTDPSLIKACGAALDLLSIDYRVYTYVKLPPRKPLTTIYISRHASLLRFAKLVGFSSDPKTKTLERVVEYINSRGPIYTKEILFDLYVTKKMSFPDICRHFGKHSKQQWYFSKLMRNYGIKTRSQSVAIKLALSKGARKRSNVRARLKAA